MMSLLMAETTVIDQLLDDALRALDQLNDALDVVDLGYDPMQDEVDNRLTPAAPNANLLTWPHHLVGTR